MKILDKIFNSSLKIEYVFWFPNISRTLIFFIYLNLVSKLHDPKNFNLQNLISKITLISMIKKRPLTFSEVKH